LRIRDSNMWLLARSVTPEELIVTLTSAAAELSRAKRPARNETVQMAASTVGKQLRELKLILIGA
jgi:hypothetical protein